MAKTATLALVWIEMLAPDKFCGYCQRTSGTLPIVSQDLQTIKDWMTEASQVILTIPATEFNCFELTLPKSLNARKQKLAMESLLEDKLLESRDKITLKKFVVDAEHIAVMAINSEKLQQYLQFFSEFSSALFVVPEFLLLPMQQAGLQVALFEEHVLIRTSEFCGFSTNEQNLDLFLQAALQSVTGSSSEIHISDFRANPNMPSLSAKLSPYLKYQVAKDTWVTRCMNQIPQVKQYHLLATNVNSQAETVGKWRIVWIATLALLLSHQVILMVMLHFNLQSVDNKIKDIYYQYLPKDQVYIEPAKTLKQYWLSHQEKQPEIFHILNSVSKVMKSNPTVLVQQIQYSGNIMQIQVLSPDFISLQKIIGELQAQNLVVEQKQAHSVEQLVKAQINIKEQGEGNPK